MTRSSEKLRASRRSAEYRAKRSAIAVENWKKPGYRLNVMRGILAGRLEDRFAAMLDDAAINYERQVRVGRYTCDFVLEGRVVCEVFGCFFHACPYHGGEVRAHMREYDTKRLAVIRSKGYGTLVIWEHDLRSDPADVLELVIVTLGTVYA